ncbi:MAG: pirin family protein [Neisseriaceae bacterium]|nr:pirin family protein [Neisseriaceae bacterium]
MNRHIRAVLTAQATEDGAGVKLQRVFASQAYVHTNPFVMLDEFGSDVANDYIAGFPAHPHRGFDTITFMLNGRMTHEDSTGNQGTISDNGVQWMRTGSGIIHSEMPAQTAGKMRGMQFWLNVPKALKTQKPDYVDYDTQLTHTDAGNSVRVVAGQLAGQRTPFTPEHTQPGIYFITFDHARQERLTLPEQDTALVYVLSGEAQIGEHRLGAQRLGVLSTGTTLQITASSGAEVLVCHGARIDEPMVQYGPFVMNTEEEIRQAFADYHAGLFA